MPFSPRPPIAASLGYLLGTAPSADLATKLVAGDGIDLRTTGTGNPEATNAAQVLGPKWGAVVMIADIGKGALASIVGRRLAGTTGATVASTAAVLGHCYPIWKGGKGGKGVATSIGQVLGTFPAYFPLDFAVAAATLASKRWKERAFIANSASSVVWVGSACVWWRKGWPTGWEPHASPALPIGAAVSSAVIASKFLTNPIQRPISPKPDAPKPEAPKPEAPKPEVQRNTEQNNGLEQPKARAKRNGARRPGVAD